MDTSKSQENLDTESMIGAQTVVREIIESIEEESVNSEVEAIEDSQERGGNETTDSGSVVRYRKAGMWDLISWY